MKRIEVSQWDRRDHFEFFQERRNPCLCISSGVNVENLTQYRQGNPVRFTDCVYYAAMLAANAVKELRYRLVNRSPVEFSRVNAAFTYVPSGRELHSNCVASFDKVFSIFQENIQCSRNAADINPTLTPEGGESQGLVYMTCLPTVFFTSLTNPWGDPWVDTVPRVAFGKVNDEKMMPISVEALHSFVDGKHVGEFLESVQEIVANPQYYFDKSSA
ncbi:MAG: CatA-like O-acetyltransferase [Solidesulfovibrio sp.]